MSARSNFCRGGGGKPTLNKAPTMDKKVANRPPHGQKGPPQ